MANYEKPGIDAQIGAVTFDDGTILMPKMSEATFRELSAGYAATLFIENLPKRSWRIRGLCICGQPMVVIVCLNNEQLESLSFAFIDERFPTDWSNWSKERELQRKDAHDRWLAQQLGSRREFPWGSIWSEYDPRGGGSSIGLRYSDTDK